MEVRTLEAIFGFNFDNKSLDNALNAIQGFESKVNDIMGGLKKQIKVDFSVKTGEEPKKVVKKAETLGQKAGKAFNRKFTQSIKNGFNFAAGYFAFEQITGHISNTVSEMAELSRVSGFLGISTEALSELRYAAQMSGVSVDTLDDSLKELQIRAVDAKSGTGEAAEAFKVLGLSVNDSNGLIKEPLKLLDEVADKLKTLKTQSDRIQVMDALLGDSGVFMLKMLDQGSHGLKQLRAEAKNAGHSLDEHAARSAQEMSESLTTLKLGLGGVIRPLVSALLPAIKGLASAASILSRGLSYLWEKTAVLETIFWSLTAVFGVLAVKSMIAFAPLLLTVGLVLAGIGFIILVVEDLWRAFTGGESVFKTLYEKSKEFFITVCSWIKELSARIWDSLVGGFKSAFAWVLDKLPGLKSKSKLSPEDDLAKNSKILTNQVAFAPRASPYNNTVQNHSNQNVNIAVNVKSQASAAEIGGEISSAFKKEMEKQRQNMFMGVNRYAT